MKVYVDIKATIDVFGYIHIFKGSSSDEGSSFVTIEKNFIKFGSPDKHSFPKIGNYKNIKTNECHIMELDDAIHDIINLVFEGKFIKGHEFLEVNI